MTKISGEHDAMYFIRCGIPVPENVIAQALESEKRRLKRYPGAAVIPPDPESDGVKLLFTELRRRNISW